MTEPDLLVDTSVAVPLVVAGHEAHEDVMTALERMRLGLAGHAWFETFSVLTRLPPPARRGPPEVGRILRHNFPASRFLSEEATEELSDRLIELGVAGGAVYDVLIGHVAAVHGLVLVTRDRHAVDLYRALGASIRLLA